MPRYYSRMLAKGLAPWCPSVLRHRVVEGIYSRYA
ncbi:hypothetical protein J2W51_001911 [Tardiphaga robiniae]|jgi:hypothetical protein|nr:hypothetical protein [Tardiphaga robiniae]